MSWKGSAYLCYQCGQYSKYGSQKIFQALIFIESDLFVESMNHFVYFEYFKLNYFHFAKFESFLHFNSSNLIEWFNFSLN
jgi:hypothetical protein